jgi:hypothetical protein
MTAQTNRLHMALANSSKINFILAAIIAACVAIAGLFVFLALASPTTSLYMQPSSGTHNSGNIITVDIRTNTGGENINAVQANFSYPADYLQYQSIDSTGSAFGIDASSTAGNGSVSIARGNISNVNGNVLIAKVKFKVLSKSGKASLGFTAGSAVVRSSDSENALSTTSGATYTIQVPSTPPPTSPTPKPAPTSPTSPTSPTPKPAPTSPTSPTSPGEEPKQPTPNEPNSKPVTLPTDKEPFKEPAYFFGMSTRTLLTTGVAVPLAIAALAGIIIYLRWHHSARLLTSGHNFKPTSIGGTPASSPSPMVTPSTTPANDPEPATDQAIEPEVPKTIEPSIEHHTDQIMPQIADEPYANNHESEDIITPTEVPQTEQYSQTPNDPVHAEPITPEPETPQQDSLQTETQNTQEPTSEDDQAQKQ